MSAVDIAILGILLVSAGISFLRGFVKEVFSLAAWLIAIWVAVEYTGDAANLLNGYIVNPSIRIGVSFVLLFVVTLFLGSMTNFLLGTFVKKTGLTGTDRMVGLLFGTIRGGAVVSVLVLLAGITEIPNEHWWNESIFLGHFEQMAFWLRDNLPPELASNIAYN